MCVHVSHAERRMAAQQSLISNLEARLGELEQSNRLLKQGNQRWQIPRPPHASVRQRSPH